MYSIVGINIYPVQLIIDNIKKIVEWSLIICILVINNSIICESMY